MVSGWSKSIEIDRIDNIIFEEPLCFIMVFDGVQFTIANDFLNVYVSACSSHGCIDELLEDLKVLWNEYAMCEDSKLSEPAKNVKKYLLERVKNDT